MSIPLIILIGITCIYFTLIILGLLSAGRRAGMGEEKLSELRSLPTSGILEPETTEAPVANASVVS